MDIGCVSAYLPFMILLEMVQMLPLNPATYVFPDQNMKTKIRHMLHPDIKFVLEIDSICFNSPTSKEELLEYVDTTNVPCKVLVVDDKVVAFHLYKMNPDGIDILKLGVHPDFRRKGYASRLIKEAYRKLTAKRSSLTCVVSEYSDEAIAFLRFLGFRATCVCRKTCEDGSDGYNFSLVLPESVTSQ